MKKTKIVCTLGPATDDEQILGQMIESGMDVARVNLSHSDHQTHAVRAGMIKRLREQYSRPIALLADTKGPEIRLGIFPDGPVQLEAGQTFTLTTQPAHCTDKIAFINYKNLPADVARGAMILLDDGLISLQVESITDNEITCTVVSGGPISSHKGVNIPGIKLSMPYISSADRADLRFAVENDFDFIACSFTRSAEDLVQVKQELARLGSTDMRLIAKIENAEGVENIDQILQICDGVMVARGDLGVEIPLEEIPALQKILIRKAYDSGKQVITATQMLESMIHNPRPTRAETTDVANAIYDGTSAIMLSGETAVGAYPVETVRTMSRIAERTERDINYQKRFSARDPETMLSVTNAISHATCAAAHDLNAEAIITVTTSGITARQVSRFRPACPIIAGSPLEKVVRQMNLSWGVTPLLIELKDNSDALFSHMLDVAAQHEVVQEGDLVIFTAGVPLGVSGTTNMMRVCVVGEHRY